MERSREIERQLRRVCKVRKRKEATKNLFYLTIILVIVIAIAFLGIKYGKSSPECIKINGTTYYLKSPSYSSYYNYVPKDIPKYVKLMSIGSVFAFISLYRDININKKTWKRK